MAEEIKEGMLETKCENMNETILEMDSISKRFGSVQALNNVSFSVKRGSVHILCGENGAGKSTLIKILNGIYIADEGKITFKGNEVKKHTPKSMLDLGIATIHQELSPVYDMTIWENVFLGREIMAGAKTVNKKKMYAETKKIINDLGFDFDPNAKMSSLTVSEMQIIEIVKAISREASLIIMDEPTSSITSSEVDMLFEQIKLLKSKGIGIIYITHKMDEIFRIGDELTVIRDGQVVESRTINAWTIDEVISKMVGRQITEVYPVKTCEIGETRLEVKGLSSGKTFDDISFNVKAGEILGFAGLVGAGRTEVFRAVFGLDRYQAGEIILDGKVIKNKNSRDAISNGIAMVSEDRRGEGLVLCRSCSENVALPNLNKYTRLRVINKNLEADDVNSMIKAMNIKLASPRIPAYSLSGGNQQKLVLSKWILGNAKVMIFDEPTRGIDVGAKYEIYKIMCDLAEKGIAVVMISSELPELIGMSDRIVVMAEGKIRGILDKNEGKITQEKVMSLATGGEA